MDDAEAVRFPNRRAAAERNRATILATARAAFAEPRGDVSMVEIARRAGVGMATLYRNFPGRLELLEALYDEEVDALCAAAAAAHGATPFATVADWLRRFFAFVPSKRLIISELLEHADPSDPVFSRNRARVLDAGEQLVQAAQRAGELRADVTLEQILDLIVAISRSQREPGYLEPMFQVALDGLRVPPRAGG